MEIEIYKSSFILLLQTRKKFSLGAQICYLQTDKKRDSLKGRTHYFLAFQEIMKDRQSNQQTKQRLAYCSITEVKIYLF